MYKLPVSKFESSSSLQSSAHNVIFNKAPRFRKIKIEDRNLDWEGEIFKIPNHLKAVFYIAWGDEDGKIYNIEGEKIINECEQLYKILDNLKKQGVSMIFITHRFEDMYRMADRVTVFRDATYIGTWNMKGLNEKKLIKAMVGRELTTLYPKRKVTIGPEVLKIDNIYVVHYITKSEADLIYRTSIWKENENIKLYFHQASILKENIELNEY